MPWASGYKVMTASGLPFDWATILVGWRGFGSGLGTGLHRRLSGSDVTEIALDRVGYGTDEQDRIAALLVNSDPTDRQMINRYLEELASEEPLRVTLHQRRWRYAHLNHLLNSVKSADAAWTEDEEFSLGDRLTAFWLDYSDLPDSASMIPEWGVSAREVLDAHHAWLAREGLELGAYGAPIRCAGTGGIDVRGNNR